MSHDFRIGRFIARAGAVIALLTLVRPGWSQQRAADARPPRSGEVTAQRPVIAEETAANRADQKLAALLAIANEEEIQLGRLAIEDAHDSHVKAFAEKMVKDHEAFLTQLEKFGARPMLGADAPAADASELARENRATGQAKPAAGNGNPKAAADRQPATAGEVDPPNATQRPRLADTHSVLDLLAIKRQIAEQCVKSAQENWAANESPNERDLAYVGQQVVLHQQMLDALKVLRQYASSDLQMTLKDGMETTAEHLETAKELIKSPAANETARPSNRGVLPDGGNRDR